MTEQANRLFLSIDQLLIYEEQPNTVVEKAAVFLTPNILVNSHHQYLCAFRRFCVTSVALRQRKSLVSVWEREALPLWPQFSGFFLMTPRSSSFWSQNCNLWVQDFPNYKTHPRSLLTGGHSTQQWGLLLTFMARATKDSATISQSTC